MTFGVLLNIMFQCPVLSNILPCKKTCLYIYIYHGDVVIGDWNTSSNTIFGTFSCSSCLKDFLKDAIHAHCSSFMWNQQQSFNEYQYQLIWYSGPYRPSSKYGFFMTSIISYITGCSVPHLIEVSKSSNEGNSFIVKNHWLMIWRTQ